MDERGGVALPSRIVALEQHGRRHQDDRHPGTETGEARHGCQLVGIGPCREHVLAPVAGLSAILVPSSIAFTTVKVAGART